MAGVKMNQLEQLAEKIKARELFEQHYPVGNCIAFDLRIKPDHAHPPYYAQYNPQTAIGISLQISPYEGTGFNIKTRTTGTTYFFELLVNEHDNRGLGIGTTFTLPIDQNQLIYNAKQNFTYCRERLIVPLLGPFTGNKLRILSFDLNGKAPPFRKRRR